MGEDASLSDSGDFSLPGSRNFATEGTDFDIFSVHDVLFFQDVLKETTLYAGKIGVISKVSGDVVEDGLITTNGKFVVNKKFAVHVNDPRMSGTEELLFVCSQGKRLCVHMVLKCGMLLISLQKKWGLLLFFHILIEFGLIYCLKI